MIQLYIARNEYHFLIQALRKVKQIRSDSSNVVGTPGLSRFWDQSQANSALYSAFWSAEQTDFKNVIVENIHWALFEDAEVAEVKWPRNSASEAAHWILI